MQTTTHGVAIVQAGRAHLVSDYHVGDGGPGELSLTLEDQETLAVVEGRLRLDPWFADTYELFDWRAGDCLTVCGAQAVVAVRTSALAIASSVALEYEEAETLDRPWFHEIPDRPAMLIATDRRIWCLGPQAAITWIWSCRSSQRESWIAGPPAVVGARVRVPLGTLAGTATVELSLADGLSI
jgi:hypothetical protein